MPSTHFEVVFLRQKYALMKNLLILITLSCLAFLACNKEKILSYEEQLDLDIVKIDDYLNSKGIKNEYQITASSLYYKITDEGNADGVKPGFFSTVTIKYKGYFFNGEVFDETEGTKVAQFAVNDNTLIAGFREGLQLLNKKGKVTIILPSGLAYGRRGAGGEPPIPPDTPIIFDLELVDFF